MNYKIIQDKLTEDLKKQIFRGFSQHAIESKGFDGLAEDSISFVINDNDKLIAAGAVQMFWGQLHIKYLFVDNNYRKQGLARMLMEHVFQYGKSRNCDFAFVETMNFQAPEFYQKLGFKIELKRDGYSGGTSLYYLKREL